MKLVFPSASFVREFGCAVAEHFEGKSMWPCVRVHSRFCLCGRACWHTRYTHCHWPALLCSGSLGASATGRFKCGPNAPVLLCVAPMLSYFYVWSQCSRTSMCVVSMLSYFYVCGLNALLLLCVWSQCSRTSTCGPNPLVRQSVVTMLSYFEMWSQRSRTSTCGRNALIYV